MVTFRFFLIAALFAAGFKLPAASTINFLHQVTPENTHSRYTVISHPAADRYAEAILVVVRKMNIPKGYHQAIPILNYIRGQWRLFFHDGRPIPNNAKFLIAIQKVPSHQAFSLAISSRNMSIENPLLNENPNAKFYFSFHRKGDGAIKWTDIQIFYDRIQKRWRIKAPQKVEKGRINILIEKSEMKEARFVSL